MRKGQNTERRPLDDDAIITLFWQRDEAAIRETDSKYGGMLYRIAYNILADNEDAEECKNDAYLGLWRGIPPARPGVFPAFASRMIRNIAINRYKEKRSKKRIPSSMTASLEELSAVLVSDTETESIVTFKELGVLISTYVQNLSKRERYLFIGRFYMGETMEHLAKGLGVGIATVHRILEKLKQELKAYLKGNGVEL